MSETKRRIFGARIVYCPSCKKNVFTKGTVGFSFRCGECNKFYNPKYDEKGNLIGYY